MKPVRASHFKKTSYRFSEGDTYNWQKFDRILHAIASQFIGLVSPVSYRLAFADWFFHLSIAPAKQLDIAQKCGEYYLKWLKYLTDVSLNIESMPCIECEAYDKRFTDDLWQFFPFNTYSQAFLLAQELWNTMSTGINGISRHHEYVVNFVGRQLLDIISPANFPWTNPEVILTTIQQGGNNFVNGLYNLMDDVYHQVTHIPSPELQNFKVGTNVAVTKGKVIYRNKLIELIQYEPTTKNVNNLPILIIPAWIMKYYILDLSPHNSLVKYLVDAGHTVFMISWKNPTQEDHGLGLIDYINYGIMDAIEQINQIIPDQQIHAVGYCIGGTLLTMAAAAMAAKSDDRLKSISLFAAQVDFKDPGEISLFMDESQIAYLEDIMWSKGYLDGSQMAGAFSMLRSIDLIWSRIVRSYLLGKKEKINDLIAWDNDTTRLPYRMHSEYLRSLYLYNDLVERHFKLNGHVISLNDINLPIFVISTITDHIAPWESVYKINYATDTDVTFALTNGGHNAGVISEPGHPGREFQALTKQKSEKRLTPEVWLEKAPHYEGSWWPYWEQWLKQFSSTQVLPPSMGIPDSDKPILGDAPGEYVLEI